MIKCELCKKNRVTHIYEVNGKYSTNTIAMCTECWEAMQERIKILFIDNSFTLEDLQSMMCTIIP